jgi:hypothetical protein
MPRGFQDRKQSDIRSLAELRMFVVSGRIYGKRQPLRAVAIATAEC